MVKEVPGQGGVCRPGVLVYVMLVDILVPRSFGYPMGSRSILLHTADSVCQINQHNIEVVLVKEQVAEEESK